GWWGGPSALSLQPGAKSCQTWSRLNCKGTSKLDEDSTAKRLEGVHRHIARLLTLPILHSFFITGLHHLDVLRLGAIFPSVTFLAFGNTARVNGNTSQSRHVRDLSLLDLLSLVFEGDDATRDHGPPALPSIQGLFLIRLHLRIGNQLHRWIDDV